MPDVIKAGETVAARKSREMYIVDANGSPVTGATVTVRVMKDAVDAAGLGSVTEVSAANRPGLYLYQFHATEIATAGPATIRSSASGAVDCEWNVLVTENDVYTAGATESEVAAQVIADLGDGAALTALASAADLAAIDTVVDAIQAVTDSLPDGGALTTLLTNVSDILTDTGTTLDAKVGAVQTAVAALNNIGASDVETAVNDALDAVGLSSSAVTMLEIASLLSGDDWTRVGDVITLKDGTTLTVTEDNGKIVSLVVNPAA